MAIRSQKHLILPDHPLSDKELRRILSVLVIIIGVGVILGIWYSRVMKIDDQVQRNQNDALRTEISRLMQQAPSYPSQAEADQMKKLLSASKTASVPGNREAIANLMK